MNNRMDSRVHGKRKPSPSQSKHHKKRKRLSQKTISLPKDKGVDGILKFMQDNEENAKMLSNALVELLNMLNEEKTVMSDEGKRFIASIMKKHIAKEEVQTYACRVLAALAFNAEDGDIIYTQPMISPVVLAMKYHPGSKELQAAATEMLLEICVDESAIKEIGRLGGVQDTLSALRAFPHDLAIASNCCGTLLGLAHDFENAKFMVAEGGLQDITKAIEEHMDDVTLCEVACIVLAMLSFSVDHDVEMSVVSCLLQALMTHKKREIVVRSVFLSLAKLVELDALDAYKLFNGEEGYAFLVEAFREHMDNADIVYSFAYCIEELSKSHDDLRTYLDEHVKELLTDTSLKFEEVNNRIQSTLKALDGKS